MQMLRWALEIVENKSELKKNWHIAVEKERIYAMYWRRRNPKTWSFDILQSALTTSYSWTNEWKISHLEIFMLEKYMENLENNWLHVFFLCYTGLKASTYVYIIQHLLLYSHQLECTENCQTTQTFCEW